MVARGRKRKLRNKWWDKTLDELVQVTDKALSHYGALAKLNRRTASNTRWLTVVIAILTTLIVFTKEKWDRLNSDRAMLLQEIERRIAVAKAEEPAIVVEVEKELGSEGSPKGETP